MKGLSEKPGKPREPEISVIIPTLDCPKELERLLGSIADHPGPELETIVVDSSTGSETSAVATKFGGQVIRTFGDRAIARNLGAKNARAMNLLFLDSDMEVLADAVMCGLRALESYEAVVVRETIVPRNSYWARVREWEKDSNFGCPYFEAPRFFRKAVFLRSSGYDPYFTGLEDIELECRLLGAGCKIGHLDFGIVHHEETIGLAAYLQRRKRYGVADQRMKSAHPEFYKGLTSPSLRARATIDHLKRAPTLASLSILPGLTFMRACEVVIRESNPNDPSGEGRRK